ncbi:hypothetical protein QF035_003372 [Streptomyces umbrinus]|uniref:Uncharacterized protein n=1 Tax=Streptomyces umbrinus TaxID=67370 RepID=A0ABU0SQF1_9ACTN|nr:hypothetical protein [Streptomyces umbrinus]MDQ1025790.1 hypothetical protein [Streptomyces umbrinus]
MYEYVSRPDHRRSDRDRLVRRLRRTDDTSAAAPTSATPTPDTDTDTARGAL